MLFNILMALGALGLAAWDATLTAERIEKYGTVVELNRTVQWLSEHLGAKVGVQFGIMLPSVILVSIGLAGPFPALLGFVFGIRTLTAYYQWTSIRLEKQIASLLTEQKDRSPSTASTSKP